MEGLFRNTSKHHKKVFHGDAKLLKHSLGVNKNTILEPVHMFVADKAGCPPPGFSETLFLVVQ